MGNMPEKAGEIKGRSIDLDSMTSRSIPLPQWYLGERFNSPLRDFRWLADVYYVSRRKKVF